MFWLIYIHNKRIQENHESSFKSVQVYDHRTRKPSNLPLQDFVYGLIIVPCLNILKFIRWMGGGLVVFYVPSTARSFRDCIPHLPPLRRTQSSVFIPFPPGIEPQAVAWQSITLPLRRASSTKILILC